MHPRSDDDDDAAPGFKVFFFFFFFFLARIGSKELRASFLGFFL